MARRTHLVGLIALLLAACGSNGVRPVFTPDDTTPPDFGVESTAAPQDPGQRLAIPGPLGVDGIGALLSDYLPTNLLETPFGGEPFCAYDQYGWEQDGASATVWLWARCTEYSTEAGDAMVANGDLWIGTSVGGPIVVSLSETSAGWAALGHQDPLVLDANTIRDIFPAEYAEIVLETGPRRDLSAETEHAARSQLAS